MAGRMSNKDRIAKMAAEKAAEKKAKAAKKKKPARKRKKKATTARAAAAAAAKTGARMRLVWIVCDQAGNPVKSFLYPERSDADAEAARLTGSKGKIHFVKKDKEPMPLETSEE